MGLELELKDPAENRCEAWTYQVLWMKAQGVHSATWDLSGTLLQVVLDGGIQGGQGMGSRSRRSNKIPDLSLHKLPNDPRQEGEMQEGKPKAPANLTAIAEVWTHWLARCKRDGRGRMPNLDNRRARAIADRLAEGFSVEDLQGAADGIWASHWHRENKQIKPELCYRDTAHVERFLDEVQTLSLTTPPAAPMTPQEQLDLPSLEDTAAAAKRALEAL